MDKYEDNQKQEPRCDGVGHAGIGPGEVERVWRDIRAEGPAARKADPSETLNYAGCDSAQASISFRPFKPEASVLDMAAVVDQLRGLAQQLMVPPSSYIYQASDWLKQFLMQQIDGASRAKLQESYVRELEKSCQSLGKDLMCANELAKHRGNGIATQGRIIHELELKNKALVRVLEDVQAQRNVLRDQLQHEINDCRPREKEGDVLRGQVRELQEGNAKLCKDRAALREQVARLRSSEETSRLREENINSAQARDRDQATIRRLKAALLSIRSTLGLIADVG